jgi:hypothetical protein
VFRQGQAFTTAETLSPAGSQLEQESLQLHFNGDANLGSGQQLQLVVNRGGAAATTVSLDLPSGSIGHLALLNQLAHNLNQQEGLSTGADAFLRFSVDTRGGKPELVATALNPGVHFSLVPTISSPAANGSGTLTQERQTSHRFAWQQQLTVAGTVAMGDTITLAVRPDLDGLQPDLEPIVLTVPITGTNPSLGSIATALRGAIEANQRLNAFLEVSVLTGASGTLLVTARDGTRFSIQASHTPASAKPSPHLTIEALTSDGQVRGRVVNVSTALASSGALVVGAATVDQSIANTLSARVIGSNASLRSAGDLTIRATSHDKIQDSSAVGVATSVAALAGAVLVNRTDATVTSTVLAEAAGTLTASGTLTLEAKGRNALRSVANGGSLGGGVVGAAFGQMVAHASRGREQALSGNQRAEVEASVADGATVMLAPVPRKVPPQLVRYHLHCAPVPSEPPDTVSVTAVPALTLLAEATADVGAMLDVLMVRFSVAVFGQPLLLVVT